MWRNRPPFSPFRQCFLWPAVHCWVSREMSECGQVVITGALIFPLQVLKPSENNLHSPPVKVLWLHCRGVLMLPGNQVITHKRETLPFCKLHELNQIQVRSAIPVISYDITPVRKTHLNSFHCAAKLFFVFIDKWWSKVNFFNFFFYKNPRLVAGWMAVIAGLTGNQSKDRWCHFSTKKWTQPSESFVHPDVKWYLISLHIRCHQICQNSGTWWPGNWLGFLRILCTECSVSLACVEQPESQFGSV